MSHLPRPDVLKLGVSGFTYADLYQPERLRDLHDVFLRDVEQAEPDLRRRWDEYRQAPDAPRPPRRCRCCMSGWRRMSAASWPGCSASTRPSRSLAAATRAQDDLFRFKVDFVRRRVLPLLKGGAPSRSGTTTSRLVRQLVEGQFPSDGEMALARAGCLLLDREASRRTSRPTQAEQAAVAEAIEALKRWCAVAPARRGSTAPGSSSAPENVDYFNLVDVEHRRPDLPTAIEGPAGRLRRRDGFTLTDPRMTPARS